MDSLPVGVRGALADVIDAFRTFENAMFESFDGYNATPLTPLLDDDWELNGVGCLELNEHLV